MSELCLQCRHRRAADTSAETRLNAARVPAAAQAVLLRQRHELEAAVYLEDLLYRQKGGGRLDRRPVRHDWCAAPSQSSESEGRYYFCDWLTEHRCPFFQCTTSVRGCPRCETGQGVCTSGVDDSHDSSSRAGAPTPIEVSPAETDRRVPDARARDAPARDTPAHEWSLPLGPAFMLQTMRRPIPVSEGGFQLDYEFEELTNVRPAIRDGGLTQTYMIFGGPGAGKTWYFQYLLQSLLAHHDRPGCLLLDPKGVLTPWLQDTLGDLRRENDLTVLEEGANQAPFNILGDDLRPSELGRLLSEVVLAGAEGVPEDWGVLITDLLAAASVIIHADNEAEGKGPVTAAALLEAILYRKPFISRRENKRVETYPIIPLARKHARSPEPDVQIAADRIREYFSTIEGKQQRFVRQIIERSLSELRSPKWMYLSGRGDAKIGDSLYSGIIHDHRIVSVAVGQSSPAFQRSMSTLVKSIFQQAVLADLSRRSVQRHSNEGDAAQHRPSTQRPFFILACDEYAQAITEGASGLVSDSRFFSLSREAGCLSLLALQSVATGRSRFPAAMRDRWEGILGNVTVKFFMKLNDVETAEMASALAGTRHSFIPVLSQQQSAQGLVASEGVTMVEHPLVPSWYLTNRMPQGYALVHGTLDGRSAPVSIFVSNPRKV